MKTQEQNNIIMPSQRYAETARGIAEIATLHPRKTPKLRAQAQEIETTLNKRVAELAEDLPNLPEIWQGMINYYSRQLPRRTVTSWGHVYTESEADRLKKWLEAMTDLLYCLDCGEPTGLQIAVSWNKAIGGWNPTATVTTVNNGRNWTARTPGNSGGYDKLSTAIGMAMRNSYTIRKFLIVNWHKIKDCYGVNAYNGLPQIDIDGKGISTLETLLEKAGWKNAGYQQRIYKRRGMNADFIGAFYSKGE